MTKTLPRLLDRRASVVMFEPLRDERHKSARAYSAVAAWLDRRTLEGKAPRTLDGDERYTAALLRENLDLDLSDYTHHVIERFLVGVPAASRRKYRAHFAVLFEWAELEDLIERNPMPRVAKFERPRQKIVPTFSDAEVEALTSLDDPDGALYLILFDAGLRSSEARALQVKHIVFERNLITVYNGKGAKDRLIPMTHRLRSRLAEWFLLDGLNRNDYLWYMRRGGYEINRDRSLGPTSIKGWHSRSLKTAGVRYRKLHSTRHTFSTRALRRGMSLTAVSRILGHASIKTTDESYSHLVVDDLAAELELLEV